MELFELICEYESASDAKKAAMREIICLVGLGSIGQVFESGEALAAAFPLAVSQMHQEG